MKELFEKMLLRKTLLFENGQGVEFITKSEFRIFQGENSQTGFYSIQTEGNKITLKTEFPILNDSKELPIRILIGDYQNGILLD